MKSETQEALAVLTVVVLLLVLTAMGGCATERAPGEQPTGDICSHDGTYRLINCKGNIP